MHKYSIIESKPFDKLCIGVDTIADAVQDTLGPFGRNALLDMGINKPPKSTRDGVTVANHVLPKDRIESFGAKLVRQAAFDTNSEAGDGTSTATVLTRAIFKEGRKFVTSGEVNPIEVKRSIDDAVSKCIKKLVEFSKPVVDIKAVATISANNDSYLGGLISKAVEKVGKDGTIIVEDSEQSESNVTFQDGMVVERGWADTTHHFINNNQKKTIEFDNPDIIIINEKVSSYEPLVPILKHTMDNKRSLLLVVKDIEDTVLLFLAQNKLQRGLPIAVIKTPGFNNEELVEDLANRVGARHFNSNLRPLDTFTPEDIGGAKRIVVRTFDTTIIEGRGDITQRLVDITEQIENSESEKEKAFTRERYNRLTSSVATIKVASEGETEANDMKLRIEDAVNATRAAVSEGIVPGGGLACYLARFEDPSTVGEKILNAALESPIRAIINNTGKNAESILTKIDATNGIGYNAKTDTIEDLVKAGVIDPVKVTRTALQKASSYAGMLLCTGTAIFLEDTKEVK